MSFRHIWAITRKEFRHILRDRMTFTLVLLTPTTVLLLMAYALTVDIQHIPVAILDHDRSPTSNRFVQDILAGPDLDLFGYADSLAEVEAWLTREEIKAAVIVDPAFGQDLLALRGVSLQIIIDGTEPESGAYAVDHIGLRAEQFIQDTFLSQAAGRLQGAGDVDIVDLRVRTWYNPGLKPRVDLVPGLISLVLGFPALSVALTLAHEREHGTMEQLMATPVGRLELLLGKMLPYVLVGLANVVFIPALAVAWFRIPINGSFPLFFCLSAVFLFAVLGMGIIIGVFIRTQAAALALSFLVIFFPGFFLTGIFFPIAAMPEVVRLEALGLPGTHYAIITRGVFLQGVGLEVLWPYVIMLFGLGLAFTAVAALFFRKRLA